MSTPTEKEPLIKKDQQQTDKQKVTYRAVESDNGGQDGSSDKTFDEYVGIANAGSNSSNKEPMTYTWSNINAYCTVKDRKLWNRIFRKQSQPSYNVHLLKNVSGVANPGELLVIMGSSGAGKTTLLNILTFRCTSDIVVSGNIAVNGRRVSSNILASRMAYVQQDDLFIGTLTVKEQLLFQAFVRMDRCIPHYQRIRRVNEVISELALTKCRNTIIGIPGRLKGISGGEMKRLSFASEVLTDPSLMLCDEPTSGLDSYMACQVISVLKKLAARGKTIITTLHQPSSEIFSMFDKILLLAEGRVAFLGNGEEAYEFFKSLGATCPDNYNPADYFIQLLAVVPGKEISCRHAINTVCDKFENSKIGMEVLFKSQQISGLEDDTYDVKRNMLSSALTYKASWFEQFRAVLWRSWLSVMKEPILIKVRILQTIMVSILVGIIYMNQKLDQDGVININGALFLFITNMTFQNVFAVINVFCSELPIFLRENENGMYRTDVYFLCKTIAELPIFVAIPIIFTIITYPMIGLYPDVKHFCTTAAIVILVANVSTAFGSFISCISKNTSMALSVGPPVIIPFLLFGGFFLNAASVPAYFKWFSALSWFRYGNEALLINQWADIDSIDCTRSNATCPKSGAMILQTLNFSEDNFWIDVTALISLMMSFRVGALLALLFKTMRRSY